MPFVDWRHRPKREPGRRIGRAADVQPRAGAARQPERDPRDAGRRRGPRDRRRFGRRRRGTVLAAQDDPRLRVTRHERNRGQPAARNEGARAVTPLAAVRRRRPRLPVRLRPGAQGRRRRARSGHRGRAVGARRSAATDRRRWRARGSTRPSRSARRSLGLPPQRSLRRSCPVPPWCGARCLNECPSTRGSAATPTARRPPSSWRPRGRGSAAC